jgi:hypothetical protein
MRNILSAIGLAATLTTLCPVSVFALPSDSPSIFDREQRYQSEQRQAEQRNVESDRQWRNHTYEQAEQQRQQRQQEDSNIYSSPRETKPLCFSSGSYTHCR